MGIDIIGLKRFRHFDFTQSLTELWGGVVAAYAMQRRQAFLFLPIFLSFGVGFYFALPIEPPLAMGGFVLVFAFFLMVALRGSYKSAAIIFFIMVLGVFAGQVRTRVVHTPVLQHDVGPVMVEGTVSAMEDLGDGAGGRVVLSELNIEELDTAHTPKNIRLKLRHDAGIYVGQRIRALAKVHPPSPPVMPGGFDFQRYLYFQGIGGVGFIYKDVEIIGDSTAGSFGRAIEKIRQGIGTRIERAMAYPQAGVAMALMIGRKTAIDDEGKEAMRASGLAHMLAISGLHMGLFSGAIFFLVRLFLSFVPGLALHYPIKKYAAVMAMLGGLSYMFLAGASVPTQRAMLMTGIVFLAIILDRSPISLRLVAFAAFVVLLFFPESLLSASFHMSFAAVTGLIAFYDWLRPHWSAWHRQAGFMRRAGLYFLGVSITTVIATAATAPFALYHFQQLAVYSIMGNFVAVPLLAFVIMPSVLAALALMPFGLEFVPLYITNLGVGAVLDIAHWVSALPHAQLNAPIWPQGALIAIVFSGLCLVLLRGYGRLVFLAPLMVAGVIIHSDRLPDILVSADAKLVSVRDGGGDLYVSSLRASRFARENWVQAYGLHKDRVHSWPKEGGDGAIFCGEMACRISVKGRVISVLRREDAARAECAQADIVVAPFPLYRLCGRASKAQKIDYYATKDFGAQALWFNGGDVTIKTAQGLRGHRPWSTMNDNF